MPCSHQTFQSTALYQLKSISNVNKTGPDSTLYIIRYELQHNRQYNNYSNFFLSEIPRK